MKDESDIGLAMNAGAVSIIPYQAFDLKKESQHVAATYLLISYLFGVGQGCILHLQMGEFIEICADIASDNNSCTKCPVCITL